ncbi:MAG: GDSL-type esterase/lipase family protein [candidate division KSB1 bacterium]|nr:GDSL-type esterase/lipase family protein [candidate division KSB1 bacterium]
MWTHVAFTFDNAKDSVHVYVNGVQAGPGARQPKDMPDTDAPVLIGAHPYSPLHNAVGLIDEVRIWNYARSAAEIRATMTRPLTGSESGLIGYWRFEEGRAQISADLTGNGNTVRLGATDSSDVSDPLWASSAAPIADGSFLNVTVPTGGERWLVGSTQEINWVAPGFSGEIKIEFTTDLQLVTMMPLGDAITRGDVSTPMNGYRRRLYTLLTHAGIAFDFVGSQRDGNFSDNDHEGHSGWTSAQLLDSLSVFWMPPHPKVIFLYIGTNDITNNVAPSQIILNLGAIVDRIYQNHPATEMYLALLIPRNDAKDANNNALNNLISNLVAEKRSHGYRIFLVNHFRPFKNNPDWIKEYMVDTVHPNEAGYAVMAQTWFEAFMQHSAYARSSGNGTWQTIVGSTPNSGSYRWLVPNVPSTNCFVRIADADHGVTLDRSDRPFQIDSAVGVSDANQNPLPTEFKLIGNYPNPVRVSNFSSGSLPANDEVPLATRIVYQLPQPSRVKLALYDLLGREVMTLVDGEQEAGMHQAVWNSRDKTGRLLPAGIYIYTLTAGPYRSVKKLLLLR